MINTLCTIIYLTRRVIEIELKSHMFEIVKNDTGSQQMKMFQLKLIDLKQNKKNQNIN